MAVNGKATARMLTRYLEESGYVVSIETNEAAFLAQAGAADALFASPDRLRALADAAADGASLSFGDWSLGEGRVCAS